MGVQELRTDLAAEHAAVDAMVATIDDASWATKTLAEGWDVRSCKEEPDLASGTYRLVI